MKKVNYSFKSVSFYSLAFCMTTSKLHASFDSRNLLQTSDMGEWFLRCRELWRRETAQYVIR
jgi:hypothetical protein